MGASVLMLSQMALDNEKNALTKKVAETEPNHEVAPTKCRLHKLGMRGTCPKFSRWLNKLPEYSSLVMANFTCIINTQMTHERIYIITR
jgi:hypothetical protein